MNKRARYICFEGCEGLGKSTQTQKLVDHLRNKGFQVLQTKEPGTPHSPLTMQLRSIMLDLKYEEQLTAPARELISQAVRSIHLEKVIVPALNLYDYIVQDRGILSGLAYGSACGNDENWLLDLTRKVATNSLYTDNARLVYDDVIYLRGNIEKGLKAAQSAKQEFEAGDAIEAKGISFLEKVASNMERQSRLFNTRTVTVDGKNIDQVFSDIIKALDLKE
jgi:dTMP kinase